MRCFGAVCRMFVVIAGCSNTDMYGADDADMSLDSDTDTVNSDVSVRWPADDDSDGVHALLDCNDSDASVFQLACLDSDDDGLCGFGAPLCVGRDVPDGYVPLLWNTGDCDDNDPLIQLGWYQDGDSDGDRSAVPTVCVSNEEHPFPPEGYFMQPGRDCNDSDPAVASHRPDIQGDDVDANCDGEDLLQVCFDGTYLCLPERDRWGDSLQSRCNGPLDLAIMSGGAWISCDTVDGYFDLANIGDEPYIGNVLIRYDADMHNGKTTTDDPASSAIVMVSLQAGQWIRVQIPYYIAEVSVTALDASDCDPTNNQFQLSTSIGYCSQ